MRRGTLSIIFSQLPATLLACESYENETLAASLRKLDGACDKIRTGLDCKDEDLEGGTKNDVDNADDCCALCAADSGCKAWTVYPERKVCYLKSGCSNTIQNEGTSGGPAMPLQCGTDIRTGVDCMDDDLSDGTKTGVSDAHTCCALCAADSRCKAWTVYPDRSVCYLKSDCSNPISQDATSGGSATPPSPSGPCTVDTWEILPDMPVAIGEVFATVVDGRIIVAGEEHDSQNFPTLEYNIAERAWTKHAPRPFTGNHHTAELINGQVTLFGGFDHDTPGKVQVYNPSNRTWSQLDDMPWATGSACSWLVSNKVYVCGGILGNGHGGTTDQCYTYDIGSQSWTQFASMPEGRNHAACATDGRRLWLFGGRMGNNVPQNGDDTVMVYDTQQEQWDSSDFKESSLMPLPQRRGGTGRAVLANSEFYIFGGETGDDPSATSNWVFDRVDIYNSNTNSWRAGSPMPKARHGMFPVLFNDKIYVAGGGVHHGNSQVTTFTAYCVGDASVVQV